MAKIGLPKWSGKRLKVREKSVKSQGILKWILIGNPDFSLSCWLYRDGTVSDFLVGCLYQLFGHLLVKGKQYQHQSYYSYYYQFYKK